MRKVILIASAVVGVIVVIVAATFLYAVSNLDSIIEKNRQQILTRLSDSLGREVHVSSIKAQLGWGVMADLSGVSIADDPAYANEPFVQASDVAAQVEVMPLVLSRQIRVSKVTIEKPEIRIIRDRDGRLNVSTIGGKKAKEQKEQEAGAEGDVEGSPMTAAPGKSRSEGKTNEMVSGLRVRNFAIDGGKVIYQESGQKPLVLSQIDLEVTNFSFASPFDLDLRLAALGSDSQNLKLVGQVGPLTSAGKIDAAALPLDLKLTAGPVAMAAIRESSLGKSIPPKLEVSDAVSIEATLKGRLDALRIHADTNLSSNKIAFGDSFQKASGDTLKVSTD